GEVCTGSIGVLRAGCASPHCGGPGACLVACRRARAATAHQTESLSERRPDSTQRSVRNLALVGNEEHKVACLGAQLRADLLAAARKELGNATVEAGTFEPLSGGDYLQPGKALGAVDFCYVLEVGNLFAAVLC